MASERVTIWHYSGGHEVGRWETDSGVHWLDAQRIAFTSRDGREMILVGTLVVQQGKPHGD